MRARSVLVLLVVVVGLLAFIWFYERKLPSSEERAELAKRVLDLERDEVTALELERDDQRLRLERQTGSHEKSDEAQDFLVDDEWRLVAPLSARADRGHVDRLLDTLSSLEKKRTLEDVVASEVGLDPPRARVRVHAAGAETELLIGSEVPASGSMIVAVAGAAPAYVVSDLVWSDVTRPPGEWRSKEVFARQRDDIERVVLTRGEQRVLLARRGQEFWLETPVADRADAEKVRELLTSLTNLRVAQFMETPDKPLATLGLDPPLAGLEVVLRGEEEPFRLAWGAAVPESDRRVFARAEGQLFETDSDLGAFFDHSVEAWRSLAVTSLETYQIDAVQVVDPDAGTLDLERAGADWKRDQLEEISFTSVSDFLYGLTGINAERLLSEDQAHQQGIDLVEPMLQIAIRGEDREQSVSLYPRFEDAIPVRTDDRQVVLMVSPADVDEMLAKLDEVRKADSKTAPEESDENSAEES